MKFKSEKELSVNFQFNFQNLPQIHELYISAIATLDTLYPLYHLTSRQNKYTNANITTKNLKKQCVYLSDQSSPSPLSPVFTLLPSRQLFPTRKSVPNYTRFSNELRSTLDFPEQRVCGLLYFAFDEPR